MRIPAICRNCKQIFASSFNASGRSVAIHNNAAICPNCGGMADLLDVEIDHTGFLKLMEGARDALRKSDLSNNDLSRLVEYLLNANRKGANVKNVTDEMYRNIPNARPVAEWLAKILESQKLAGIGSIGSVISALIAAAYLFFPGRDINTPRPSINNFYMNDNRGTIQVQLPKENLENISPLPTPESTPKEASELVPNPDLESILPQPANDAIKKGSPF
ncbi:MAG: hypothetical protein R3A44_01150 [Caldilineaceae bacterium]